MSGCNRKSHFIFLFTLLFCFCPQLWRSQIFWPPDAASSENGKFRNSLGMDFVRIEPGVFYTGGPSVLKLLTRALV
jgi:hypothetical protein